MLEKILFNEIPVRNMETSISWYKEVLGLQLIWYSGGGAGTVKSSFWSDGIFK
ncbi:hypothetical protein J27TS8_39120 [Robertmurraya siralis]|uniref:VOC domain-containing protein n=1 Tax=Robertmurraya siralis TaxID=77777 RepID=A0A920BVA3_9BACI|nr:VOC family protein [Robertmurraya siralis]PAE19292.1 hypothetical protein CHH80_16960 [Bacillus sp. 7504-2]GIN63919.1 hypothetical protein J27TS8_39120 [Robertmurraya siralis]